MSETPGSSEPGLGARRTPQLLRVAVENISKVSLSLGSQTHAPSGLLSGYHMNIAANRGTARGLSASLEGYCLPRTAIDSDGLLCRIFHAGFARSSFFSWIPCPSSSVVMPPAGLQLCRSLLGDEA